MRIFGHRFKKILTSAVFITLFAAYGPVFAETTETKEGNAHRAHNSQDWPGIYYGSLPCDDCVGIKTQLALNNNHSYVLISQYLGKSDREFVEKGKYTWDDKNNTIVLTPKKGSTSRQYFAGENMLIQLDANGKRIAGKLADRYILRRTDVTDSAKPHSGH